MALPAAMALSGLNEEYFEDGLNDLFQSGAVLLRSPYLTSKSTMMPLFPAEPPSSHRNAPSRNSLSEESETRSSSSFSDEPPQQLPLARNLGTFFDLLITTGNIKLAQMHPASSHYPNSDACSSRTSSLTSEFSSSPSPVLDYAPQPQPRPKTLAVIYQNRNILDLGQNISSNWDFKAAEFKTGPVYFFKNRSQYSRVLQANLPEHHVQICSYTDCLYHDYKYR